MFMGKNKDATSHVKGESLFLDDLPEPKNLFHAVVFYSPYAHGKIKKLDLKKAKLLKGVIAILTAHDIPGENQIGPIIQDQPLLAVDEVRYIGEPIAIIIAQEKKIAYNASALIRLEVEQLPVIIDPRKAYDLGLLFAPPRTLSKGNVDKVWSKCKLIASGLVNSEAQEHYYLETQRAMAIPLERGKLKILSSTQHPTGTQVIISKILNIPMHLLEVDVSYIGGGFGGKQNQSIQWAALVALAAYKLKVPVKLTLSRKEDFVMTGKRHPFSSNFKIGVDHNGKLLAYEVVLFQNGGAYADLSPAVLERALLDITGPYYIPNLRATGISCITNLHPFTAFRGFGSPQTAFIMENAIYAIAEKLRISPFLLQKKNLFVDNNSTIYGRKLKNVYLKKCWQIMEKQHKLYELVKRVNDFNSSNKLVKKGIAVLPLCYGIGSFVGRKENDKRIYFLNQASSLVNIYLDGSVSISTGAVEMGQGVYSKIIQIASQVLSISPERIEITTTSTGKISNTNPTAASTGIDLNGKATELACNLLIQRLKQLATRELKGDNFNDISIKEEQIYYCGKKTHLTWPSLIMSAFLNRVNLSSHAHYATPNIHYDEEKESGVPFSYYTYGVSITEITLDCLRGTYDIDAIHVVHDIGKSIIPLIDKGQIEGGIVQGIGWITTESVHYDDNGKIRISSSEYKVPNIKTAPQKINILFTKGTEAHNNIFGFKACGESPLLYGIGTYFAILEAMKSFKPELSFPMSTPITPEKILCQFYG